MKYFYLTLLLVYSTVSFSQFYAEGGYELSFLNQKETNRIISEFNDREGHNLADFKTLSGYRFGFGKYGRFTNMAISFGNISKSFIAGPATQILKYEQFDQLCNCKW